MRTADTISFASPIFRHHFILLTLLFSAAILVVHSMPPPASIDGDGAEEALYGEGLKQPNDPRPAVHFGGGTGEGNEDAVSTSSGGGGGGRGSINKECEPGYWLGLWERELAPLLCLDGDSEVCEELRKFAADGMDIFNKGNCPTDHGVHAFCELVAELDRLTRQAAINSENRLLTVEARAKLDEAMSTLRQLRERLRSGDGQGKERKGKKKAPANKLATSNRFQPLEDADDDDARLYERTQHSLKSVVEIEAKEEKKTHQGKTHGQRRLQQLDPNVNPPPPKVQKTPQGHTPYTATAPANMLGDCNVNDCMYYEAGQCATVCFQGHYWGCPSGFWLDAGGRKLGENPVCYYKHDKGLPVQPGQGGTVDVNPNYYWGGAGGRLDPHGNAVFGVGLFAAFMLAHVVGKLVNGLTGAGAGGHHPNQH